MKILTQVMLVFVISSQVFAQELITMQGKHYYYGPEGRILKPEMKELIRSTGDAVAIRYYSNYESGKIVGISCFVVGAALNIAGSQREEYQLYGELNGLHWAGTALYGVGVIVLIVKKQSLRNAVKRFNSLQQETKLDFGVTRNGFGLTYNF